MPASRALPLAALGGLVAALLFGAIVTGTVGGGMLFWMAPLPLFVVGLRLGTKAIALAGLIGTVLLGAAEPALGFGFAVTAALPVLLLSWLALSQPRTQVAGRLVLALGGIALVAFAIAYAVAAEQEGGLQGVATRLAQMGVDQLVAFFNRIVPGALQPSDIPSEQVQQAAAGLPGWFAAFWVSLILGGNGILAMGVMPRIGGALIAAPAMASIAVPRVVSLALMAALLAAYAGQGEVAFIGTNLVEILSVPLLFVGLGVVHARLAKHPARAMLLTAFYGVFFVFAIRLIVALGVIEQWVGLRRRFIPAPRQGEE